MNTIALYSIKGGVGKTAASVNLAYLAARDGFQTILCDLDPQGSASFYFRIRVSKKFNSKKLLKGGKKIDQNIKSTDYENLDLLPSNFSFRNLDIALDNLKRSRRRLKEILEPLKEEYDFIFLDSPPNITLVAENIFYAANYLFIPCIPTILSMRTYKKLLGFFKNEQLDQSKIFAFFSMVERRKRMHREIIERQAIKDGQFLESQIPYLSDVEKMGIYREPVVRARPRSRAAQAYEHLWREIKQMTNDKINDQ